MATTGKSSFQLALEAYLAENGECDKETFERLRHVFEAENADEEEAADGNGGFKLDGDTQKVYDAYKELTKDQQKQFCNAMRVEEVYYEFQMLDDEDKECIRQAIGESVDSYDAETFITVMEAAIDSINTFNESAEEEESLDQFDFLKD